MDTKEFAEKHHVTVSFTEVASNPGMSDPTWQARHYKVTLKHPKYHGGYFSNAQFTMHFSKGMGLPRGVEVGEVLDALASDAASIENASGFVEWAENLGMPTAPPEGARTRRQAENYGAEGEWDAFQQSKKSYEVTKKNTDALKRLLGPDLFRKLVFDTERL